MSTVIVTDTDKLKSIRNSYQKARSDLCSTCKSNTVQLSKLSNMDPDAKLQLIRKSGEHLKRACDERTEYKAQIETAKADLSNHPTKEWGKHNAPRSFVGSSHYSFDYAQQVFIPSSPEQVGSLYFLAPFKVGWFSIMAEAIPKNVLFLIPESVSINKGANAVISYLHYYLHEYGLGETIAKFHADNCVGQNKNNPVMSYFCWRILQGLHDKIVYSFLPTGHTKFGPDWGIGVAKQRFKRSEVHCLDDMSNVINQSSPVVKLNVAQLVGKENGEVIVPTYDWVTYFQEMGIHKIPNLKDYHYFEFNKDVLGTVSVKRHSKDTNLMRFTLLNDVVNIPIGLPNVLVPKGISQERAKYLFEKIRPFVNSENADVLCPEPVNTFENVTNVEDKENIEENNNVNSVNAGDVVNHKRKSPKCSYCQETGHCNRLINGTPVCPIRKQDEATT